MCAKEGEGLIFEAEKDIIHFSSRDKRVCDIIHRVRDIQVRCNKQMKLHIENDKDFKKIFKDIDNLVKK
jgi:biotin-(acetyl-CoA carboxylase) ligase